MPRNMLAFLAVLTFALLGCQPVGVWSRLSQVDPSLAILNDPQRLLTIASSYEGPIGQPSEHPSAPTIETRHEALQALLRVQRSRFQVELSPVTDTTGIDHVCIETLQSSNNLVKLLATPSRNADRKAPEGDYWSMELLDFDKSGRLLSRQPYMEPHG
jgi:hypothetical protein